MSAEDDLALATAILGGLKELLALYESAKAGRVSASDALTAAQLFTSRIEANRKAAQDALDAKFPKP